MKNLRRCNCCVVFVEDKKKSISLKHISLCDFRFTDTFVWLFSTTTNFIVTCIQLVLHPKYLHTWVMRSQLITCGYKDGYGQQRLRLERAWGFNGLTLLTPDIISEGVFKSLYIKRGFYWLSGLFLFCFLIWNVSNLALFNYIFVIILTHFNCCR